MNLEVFILGTGGMMPLPRRGLASVLLRREGELFLFDCGEGTQVALRRLNLRWKKISVIFISHTHADHVTGLPGILMLSSQVDRNDPLYIVGPPRIREYVNTSRRVLDMYINYEIVVLEIEESGVVFKTPEYCVKAHSLIHTKPCYAYCFEEEPRPGVFHPEKAESLGVPRGPFWSQLQNGDDVVLPDGKNITPSQVLGLERNGRKFCFVTDTVFSPHIGNFVQSADLLICEGMFHRELFATAREKKHLTAYEAALIARQAAAKKLGLIHFSPRYTDRETQLLLKEAQEIFPSAFLTRELQTIEIPYID